MLHMTLHKSHILLHGYSHETIALAFSLTEEAIEDNLYDTSLRYTRALARSMMQTKKTSKGLTS